MTTHRVRYHKAYAQYTLLWGLKDPIFKVRHLARWQALFTHAQTVTFPEVGHFVQEEEPALPGQLVRQFLAEQQAEGRP